jgi:hypothetical protein
VPKSFANIPKNVENVHKSFAKNVENTHKNFENLSKKFCEFFKMSLKILKNARRF